MTRLSALPRITTPLADVRRLRSRIAALRAASSTVEDNDRLFGLHLAYQPGYTSRVMTIAPITVFGELNDGYGKLPEVIMPGSLEAIATPAGWGHYADAVAFLGGQVKLLSDLNTHAQDMHDATWPLASELGVPLGQFHAVVAVICPHFTIFYVEHMRELAERCAETGRDMPADHLLARVAFFPLATAHERLAAERDLELVTRMLAGLHVLEGVFPTEIASADPHYAVPAE